MNAKPLLILGTSVLTVSLLGLYGGGRAEGMQGQYVRLAELEVDPAQLEPFKAALKEAMETAVRVEPGCLELNAVSDKENPAHITIFEIYSDEDAYKTHVQTAHFKKFRTTTDGMVKSRKLIDTVPITLAAKAK